MFHFLHVHLENINSVPFECYIRGHVIVLQKVYLIQLSTESITKPHIFILLCFRLCVSIVAVPLTLSTYNRTDGPILMVTVALFSRG
jgi:hypothetical protein